MRSPVSVGKLVGIMPPNQKSRINVLSVCAGCSILFGALAGACAAIFYLSPKTGIAVFATFSGIGSIALSTIGIAFGLVALIGCAGRSWLAVVGVLASVVPLVYLLVVNSERL